MTFLSELPGQHPRRKTMGKTWVIAAKEYLESVKAKSFIISIILAPIMMSGSGLAIFLLKDQVDTSEKKIAIVDYSEQFTGTIRDAAAARNASQISDPETGKQTKPVYTIIEKQPEEDQLKLRAKLSDEVRNKTINAFIIIDKDVIRPEFAPGQSGMYYYSENSFLSDVREWFGPVINNQIRLIRSRQEGMDHSLVERIMSWKELSPQDLVEVDAAGNVIEKAETNRIVTLLLPIGLVMMIFLLVMMAAMPLLTSVLEEKTGRIAEVLLGSAKPFQLMTGKLIGQVGVSLTASIVYLIAAVVACSFFGILEYIPFHLLPWFFIFALAAVVMSGAMCMAVGSACNEIKETQALMWPVMLPLTIPLFVLVPVLKEPNTAFATITSLIPPFTPMVMLLRMAAPESIPLWQPILGLVLVLITTAFYVWAASRIFRVGLLAKGKAPKFSDLVRWVIKG